MRIPSFGIPYITLSCLLHGQTVYLSLPKEHQACPISTGRSPCVCSLVLRQAHAPYAPCQDIRKSETAAAE